MIVPALTYILLGVSGLIGSAIAWDDLRKGSHTQPCTKS